MHQGSGFAFGRILRVGVVGVVIALSDLAAAGSFIVVTNNNPNLAASLSDLIAYGANNQKVTLLKLNDSSDDKTLFPGQSRTFDAGFDVKKYFISGIHHGSEVETSTFTVTTAAPKKLSFLSDHNTGAPLFAAVDFALGVDAPPDGATFTFVNGLADALPGWFVGTGADFDTGTVTGAFTGQAEAANALEVAVAVPETEIYALLLSGLALLGATRRRRTPSEGKRRAAIGDPASRVAASAGPCSPPVEFARGWRLRARRRS